ncbi:sensor histidine kinase [Caldanaerobius polysaccharolyticus]|uniref:sensor histidine kinase n=1 Tax=Caldanaerobius polysaccharolyticus TaxID=44256 RepID=UPI000690B5F5|nr:sensor histidine kinase [Caldanaerobius polysaccharolyticus]
MNKRIFSRLKLMQKFLLSYFMLIVIPLMILTLFTYKQVSNIVKNYITFSTAQAIDQTYSFLAYKLYKISQVIDIIRNDGNLTTILAKNPSSSNIHEQIADMTYLRQFLSSLQDNVDIYRVRLYSLNEFIYSSENVNLFSIEQAKQSKWFSILEKNNEKYLYCPSSYLEDINIMNPQLLSVAATIKNPNNYHENIGYIRVDFQKKIIDEILKKANTIKDSLTYIQNSKGDIVASSDNSLLKKYKIDNSLASKLSYQGGTLKLLTINGNQCLIASSLIKNTDWYMITIIPYSKVLSGSNAIRNELFLIMIIIGTIAYSLAYYFSNSINRRISKLIIGMRNVHDGNLNMFINDSSEDEIGELIKNYNFMISRMAVLIEEQYKLGKEIKNAELKALQAQINPHFLYNTLDMISWMSYKNMNEEIRRVVKSLAKFYKLSLNKGKDIISIKDELTHAALYTEIQNMRYSGRILLKIMADERIYEYSILKITLQPIVENSILHGILGKGEGNGTISINGKLENDEIILSVQDDGIGIPKDKIDKILSNDFESEDENGYGLKNINQRIKLYYGEKYGLSIKSEYGKGTTVEVKIPAIKM